jgi:hypothetical protein
METSKGHLPNQSRDLKMNAFKNYQQCKMWACKFIANASALA